MDFSPPRPRTGPRENIVPMINVVFLLLIFFLMTAQIAPQDPFDIAPPESGDAPPPGGAAVLFLSADGLAAHGGLTGEAALAALPDGVAVTLRADRAMAASDLARVLSQLAARGIADVDLVTTVRP